jgi:hypothetical protein
MRGRISVLKNATILRLGRSCDVPLQAVTFSSFYFTRVIRWLNNFVDAGAAGNAGFNRISCQSAPGSAGG